MILHTLIINNLLQKKHFESLQISVIVEAITRKIKMWYIFCPGCFFNCGIS